MNSRTLLFLLLLLTLGPRVQARPIFVLLDVFDQNMHPSHYGIHYSRKQVGDQVDFVVHFSREASGVLIAAQIFSPTPKHEEAATKIEVVTTEKNGQKTLTFSVPTELIDSCFLHLDSGPIPGTKTPEFNFSGYRIPLDQINGEDFLPVSATRNGDAVDFVVKVPVKSAITIEYGPQPPLFPSQRLRGLSIEGPSFHMPLQIPQSPWEFGGDVKFTLPRSLLKDLYLVVSVEVMENLVQARPKTPTRIRLESVTMVERERQGNKPNPR